MELAVLEELETARAAELGATPQAPLEGETSGDLVSQTTTPRFGDGGFYHNPPTNLEKNEPSASP